MLDPTQSRFALTRRSFVGWIGGVLALLGLRPPVSAASVPAAVPIADDQQPAALDVPLLSALGGAILPTEIGAAGISDAVRGFASWLRAYKPGAELLHGYGTGEIKYSEASPLPAWRTQLHALDQVAREKLGKGFAAATVAQRQAVVRVALASHPIRGFTAPQGAPHVALAFLSWYYDTPAATDLCYGVEIMKNQCRPLTQNPAEPAPLRKRRPDGSPRKLTREDDA